MSTIRSENPAFPPPTGQDQDFHVQMDATAKKVGGDGDRDGEEGEEEFGESEYELKRKERMAQNKAFMASLGFTEGETSLK